MIVRTLALCLLLAGPAAAQPAAQPYAGMESRGIKALDPERLAGLRSGAGLSYALAAELNGYPGPKHVLELAEQLRLTEGQRAAVERLRAAVLAEASTLGERLIAEEAALDALFASGRADAASIETAVARAAAAEAKLRAAHLRPHLATAALLTAEQRRRYAELRGYGAGHDPAAHAGHAGR